MEKVRTDFTDEVVAYLTSHHPLTISTSSFTGMPHANTAPYVNDHDHIYFFAREESILLRNLGESHHVAFTIDEYQADGRKRRELHGEGPCEMTDGEDLAHALDLVSRKYGNALPSGVLHTITPRGMYFVEYDSRNEFAQ